MHAKEPTLFLSIYIHRESPEGDDCRVAILQQVAAFVERYRLQVSETANTRYNHVDEIDLREVDSIEDTFARLFEANVGYEKQIGSAYNATIYCTNDSLIIQLQLTKFSDWQGSLKKGWDDLFLELRAGFGAYLPAEAEDSIFGVSLVFWIMADPGVRLESYDREIAGLLGNVAKTTKTDLGLLSHHEAGVPCGTRIHHDLWVLVTQREAEAEVNARYYQLNNGATNDALPPFGQTALARHKIFFEQDEHQLMRKSLKDRGEQLEKETMTFLAGQRRLEPAVAELASETTKTFEQNLSEATYRLGLYRNNLARLQELQRTLEVNQRNYTIHCIHLISARKFAEVRRSRDRLAASQRFLDDIQSDDIFGADLGTMAQHCQQVETDVGYSQSIAHRCTLALQSATEQLRIAGENEVARMAGHLAVDSAAVVASVAALVIIELAEKRHFDAVAKRIERSATSTELGHHSLHFVEGWFLVAGVVLLAYGLTYAFGSRFRGEKPGRRSTVLGFGLLFAWVGMVFAFHRWFFTPHLDDFISKLTEASEPEFWMWIIPVVCLFFGIIIGSRFYLGLSSHFQKKKPVG